MAQLLMGLWLRVGALSNPVGGGAPPATFYLLKEDGGRIQLENGSGFILLESAP